MKIHKNSSFWFSKLHVTGIPDCREIVMESERYERKGRDTEGREWEKK